MKIWPMERSGLGKPSMSSKSQSKNGHHGKVPAEYRVCGSARNTGSMGAHEHGCSTEYAIPPETRARCANVMNPGVGGGFIELYVYLENYQVAWVALINQFVLDGAISKAWSRKNSLSSSSVNKL